MPKINPTKIPSALEVMPEIISMITKLSDQVDKYIMNRKNIDRPKIRYKNHHGRFIVIFQAK